MKFDLGLGKVFFYFVSGLFLCDMLVFYKKFNFSNYGKKIVKGYIIIIFMFY